MKFKLIVILLSILLAEAGSSQSNPLFSSSDLKITWQSITNHYNTKPENLSSLTFENTGKQIIPAKGWSLWFNYGRHIFPSSETGNIVIEHVNGEIYKLSPSLGFEPLKPGTSHKITFVSEGEVLNITASPMGYYIVYDQDMGKGYPVKNAVELPIVDSTIHFVTPEDTFFENLSIKNVDENQLPLIFPTPYSCVQNKGSYILDDEIQIYADPIFKTEADYLSQELHTISASKSIITTQQNSKANIRLKKADIPSEAYNLKVTESGIEIYASDGAGVFYGIQSLRTMISPDAWEKKKEKLEIPFVEVNDAPRFKLRSLSLDIARNFQSADQLERVLDVMALYKLNVLHLHFCDDEGWRIEIPSLPELTLVGARRGHTIDSKAFLPASYGAGPEPGNLPASGFYSRNEFIQILKYATERHISVIPEIETPGHSRAAIKAMDARYEKFLNLGNREEAERYFLRDPDDKSTYISAQLWTDNVMCVVRPSVYAFLEKVIDELRAMYSEANAPLRTIHMGGDEVPEGAWEQSPLCEAFINENPSVRTIDDLWYYYFAKVNKILKDRNLVLTGWEEAALRKTELDGQKHYIPNPQFVNEGFQVDVWNNGIGWGSEDLPYRLANAGYKVILSCVSNQYLDLAYENSPDEPGLYWGGFVDIDKPFSFIPFDYYRNTKEDTGGNPISPSLFVGKDRLTEFGESNILGIQGLLWAENLQTPQRRDYLLLPKMLGLAERAWAKNPEWATEKDPSKSALMYNDAWSVFTNTLGKRELPRLSYLDKGFLYRVPPPGAIIKNGTLEANCQFPGMTIRYTTDGSKPTIKSPVYKSPLKVEGIINLAVFSVDGRRGRIVTLGKTGE